MFSRGRIPLALNHTQPAVDRIERPRSRITECESATPCLHRTRFDFRQTPDTGILAGHYGKFGQCVASYRQCNTGVIADSFRYSAAQTLYRNELTHERIHGVTQHYPGLPTHAYAQRIRRHLPTAGRAFVIAECVRHALKRNRIPI